MKILVINGPNLNMLGVREPNLYGNKSHAQLVSLIKSHCKKSNIKVKVFQFNSEEKIINKIHTAFYKKFDGIVINPAGYTHTSVAILDALKAVNIPTVEVHLTDVDSRESFRKISFVKEFAKKTIAGLGFDGYIKAIDFLKENLSNESNN